MSPSLAAWLRGAALAALLGFPAFAAGAEITGLVEPVTPQGRFLALQMTIDDATTRFVLTGPDFCYFAFGFDTDTMFGYSLIVTGLDDQRTVVEQNLEGIGDPGGPQPHQDISVISTVHDASRNLSIITLERANQTGDADDPDFSTAMTTLDVIWAYNASASPEFPNPGLVFHGRNGRGADSITFTPVPEPDAAWLAALAVAAALPFGKRRRRSGAALNFAVR